MEVEWPWRHQALVEAAELLAAEPPRLVGDQGDPRVPDLTWAVHELVDDTWWDHRDPSESIGLILRGEHEAASVRELVALVVQVSDRQGADAADGRWFSDPLWPEVMSAATRMLTTLTSESPLAES